MRAKASTNASSVSLVSVSVGSIIIVPATGKETWIKCPKCSYYFKTKEGADWTRMGDAAYVDDDAVVHKDWSAYIIAPYKDEKVGGVGGRVQPYGAEEKPVSSLNRYDVGKVFDDGLVLANFDLPTPYPIEVDTFIGCNMSFRRELLQEIGRFDENFKSMCFREEVDVCRRLKKHGYKLIYHPKALVWHKWKRYENEKCLWLGIEWYKSTLRVVFI
jgi:GT2 family glycosyltransferase